MSNDLEQIIADSVNDSLNGVETETVEAAAVETDAPAEPVEASVEAAEPEPVGEVAESAEVSSPAAQAAPEAVAEPAPDEFAKLVGMPQVGVGGRENRIPYSRVKKIVEKRASEAESAVAEAVLGRKLNAGEKAIDVVKAHVAQLPELQTKVTDYESRLENVGRFEQVMSNEPQEFLRMLAKLPAYQEFFQFVEQGAQALRQAPAAGQAPAQQAPPADPSAGMPEPDETLTDGSKVYSMEGLKALLAWNAQQVESRVSSKYEEQLKGLDERYKPIVSEYEERRRQESVLPIIRKQLEDAKTWPMFNDNEEEILGVLTNDKKISLEGAYRQVVFPKLIAERNKVRQDVIKEVQAAPTSSSIASRTVTKPVSPSAGPRSVEDVIRESIQSLK